MSPTSAKRICSHPELPGASWVRPVLTKKVVRMLMEKSRRMKKPVTWEGWLGQYLVGTRLYSSLGVRPWANSWIDLLSRKMRSWLWIWVCTENNRHNRLALSAIWAKSTSRKLSLQTWNTDIWARLSIAKALWWFRITKRLIGLTMVYFEGFWLASKMESHFTVWSGCMQEELRMLRTWTDSFADAI